MEAQSGPIHSMPDPENPGFVIISCEDAGCAGCDFVHRLRQVVSGLAAVEQDAVPPPEAIAESYQERIDRLGAISSAQPWPGDGIDRSVHWTPVIPIDDLTRMNHKQRQAYWRTMGQAEIANLMKNGNFVGEKPSREISLDDWVAKREQAFQNHVRDLVEGNVDPQVVDD